VKDRYPEVVKELMALVEASRRDLGDNATGMEGKNRRPIGRVSNPKPLTQLDPDHPYIEAMYDMEDRG
jgi:hypothetical protein